MVSGHDHDWHDGAMPAPEPPPLRRHQREALAALAAGRDAGADRAWVVLPPGAGKTLVGLLEARDHLRSHPHGHVVVLGPNTAIVNQWLAGAAELGLEVGRERDLSAPFTATTYQALAVFDPDAEVDEDGEGSGRERGELIDRLHPNGRALVEALADTEQLLVVLDECHHLLEVWGRLLADVLALLPHARVLGLTATPPEALTQDQAALVRELFGEVAYATTIPAVVREGDLAPFAELAYLVEPTALEDEWLDQESLRFRELTTRLLDPAYGSIGFLAWLHARFVEPVPHVRTWASVLRDEPELAAAALRMHHDGMLALPDGARPTEEHRRPPDADDWVLLISDWVISQLQASQDPGDAAIVEEVRRALPSIGYRLTKRGIRRGRTPTDRVLARSEAKTHAAADIIAAESVALGERLRMLVLCDHERASATLPVSLEGVLAPQAGSAIAALDTLLRDARTSWLAPVLVTGRTLSGAPTTMAELRAHLARTEPEKAAGLQLEPLDGTRDAVALTGPGWGARDWVGPVTRFFEDGGTRVLIGTRGLLGEGWNARRISGLVDLTSATSTTAVVQTRGRALRTDPTWPDKVAVTWSVVCVSEAHPRGDQDWKRLVRKHHGFFGVDESGDIADGVAHLDARFSPYAPPDVADFADINTRMLARAAGRDTIRTAWRVGEPYEGRTAVAVRITRRDPARVAAGSGPPAVVVRRDHVQLAPTTEPPKPRARRHALVGGAVAVGAGAVLTAVLPGAASMTVFALLAIVGVAAVVLGSRSDGRVRAAHLRELAAAADAPPSLEAIARAVAGGLHATAQVSRGAEGVDVHAGADGEHRIVLRGVSEEESRLFALCLDEALAPIERPRYVVCRHRVSGGTPIPDVVWSTDLAAEVRRRLRPDHTTWFAVPTALGTNAERARAYAACWEEHVGGDPTPLYTGSPEGAGVLAAQAGVDPLDVTTVMRRQWE